MHADSKVSSTLGFILFHPDRRTRVNDGKNQRRDETAWMPTAEQRVYIVCCKVPKNLGSPLFNNETRAKPFE